MQTGRRKSGRGPRRTIGSGAWAAGAVLLAALASAGCASAPTQEPPVDEWRRAELAVAGGDWDRAADLWNRIRLETYDRAVRPHLETAEALWRLGKEDEALALLRQAGELFPTEAQVPLTQGLLLERMGFRRAAELDLMAAVELAPGCAPAHLALGRVRLALDQPQAARAHLARAIALGTEGVEVHRLQARCDRALGACAEAHANYARAIELERGQRGEPSAELLVEAASLHTDPRDGLAPGSELEQALAWVTLAGELDPQCARSSFVRAGLLERAGDLDGAIEAYRRTVEIDNLHLGAITNLALLHAHRGEQERARAMVERAVALEDNVQRRRALLALVQ